MPTITNQTLEAQDVTAVTVTDVAADPDRGGYVRTIRVFGPDGTSHPAVATLVLRADTAEPLRIDLPDALAF